MLWCTHNRKKTLYLSIYPFSIPTSSCIQGLWDQLWLGDSRVTPWTIGHFIARPDHDKSPCALTYTWKKNFEFPIRLTGMFLECIGGSRRTFKGSRIQVLEWKIQGDPGNWTQGIEFLFCTDQIFTYRLRVTRVFDYFPSLPLSANQTPKSPYRVIWQLRDAPLRVCRERSRRI